jgi:hypothetical protein
VRKQLLVVLAEPVVVAPVGQPVPDLLEGLLVEAVDVVLLVWGVCPCLVSMMLQLFWGRRGGGGCSC